MQKIYLNLDSQNLKDLSLTDELLFDQLKQEAEQQLAEKAKSYVNARNELLSLNCSCNDNESVLRP